MTFSYVRYDLVDTYVHNWLVAGPQETPVANPEGLTSDAFKRDIAEQRYEAASGITDQPVEPGPSEDGWFTVGEYEGRWAYYRCAEDHLVDLSAFYPQPRHLRAWAYTELDVPEAQVVSFVLTTAGPADVWINQEHVVRQEAFYSAGVGSVSFTASLTKGRNEILVRFEQVAARACTYVMALQVVDAPSEDEGWAVCFPTTIENVERRNELEHTYEQAFLDRQIFDREDLIVLRWPRGFTKARNVAFRMKGETGETYSEKWELNRAAEGTRIGRGYEFVDGLKLVTLMPQPTEYHVKAVRIRRQIPFWNVGNYVYKDEPEEIFQDRRVSVLSLAARRDGYLFGEMAKMAVQWWDRIDVAVVEKAIARVERRDAGSVVDLAGLLGIALRYAEHEAFPEGLREPLEACILGYRYWLDEAGDDAMDFTAESRSLLFHTCEVLAGQLYPDRVFSNVGETGTWHRAQGEARAMAWLRSRATGGFAAWDSGGAFDEILVALSHLVEFAESDDLWEMASVLMDKLFFTLGLNTFKGVFGSTQGQAQSPSVKSGLLEPTGGICRLMWGMGIYNHHIRGEVSLALMENYGFPRLIQAIALDQPDEMWNRERHAPDASGIAVHKVTYKTPDYMLASAQDYRPGERGAAEHIWQATLGPAALVFVTHPACLIENPARQPNVWLGNVVLPRVAQWKDVLIAVHQLEEDDWLGFTHAYFPAYAFDEHDLDTTESGHGWAFGRKGDGYIALTAANGLNAMWTGPQAFLELRSHGKQNVWVCHMGRAAVDGDFQTFKEKILTMPLEFEASRARVTTLRGDRLEFGWEGPFMRNGEVQPLSGFNHYENPYTTTPFPAEQMDIEFSGQIMRLHLAGDPESED